MPRSTGFFFVLGGTGGLPAPPGGAVPGPVSTGSAGFTDAALTLAGGATAALADGGGSSVAEGSGAAVVVGTGGGATIGSTVGVPTAVAVPGPLPFTA